MIVTIKAMISDRYFEMVRRIVKEKYGRDVTDSELVSFFENDVSAVYDNFGEGGLEDSVQDYFYK